MKIPAPVKINYYKTLIGRFNPFLFREKETGECMFFEDYGELYYQTMMKICAQFPRGYVSLPIFIYEMTGFKPTELNSLFRMARAMRLLTNEEVLWCYWENSPDEKKTAESILRVLHLFTDTRLNQSMFDMAYNRLKIWNEARDIKNRLNNKAEV